MNWNNLDLEAFHKGQRQELREFWSVDIRQPFSCLKVTFVLFREFAPLLYPCRQCSSVHRCGCLTPRQRQGQCTLWCSREQPISTQLDPAPPPAWLLQRACTNPNIFSSSLSYNLVFEKKMSIFQWINLCDLLWTTRYHILRYYKKCLANHEMVLNTSVIIQVLVLWLVSSI